MPFALSVSLNSSIPGAVDIVVDGDPDTACALYRVGVQNLPVRNFHGIGSSGIEAVVDTEPPLGRAVHYNLVDPDGTILAQSADIFVPPIPGGYALLRSVLNPFAGWMTVTLVDDSGIGFESSSAVFPIEGSSQVTVVGGMRRYRRGTYTFATKTLAEADQLIGLLRDGVPMLLRVCPTGGVRARDTMFYGLGLQDAWWGADGARVVAVDYQAVDPANIVGDTETPPPLTWDFAALRDSADTFGELAGMWPDFRSMAVEPQ